MAIHLDSSPLSYAEVVDGWRADERFRDYFIDLLADCPYEGVRWETPPATDDSMRCAFEFVLLDSPDLVRDPDVDAFTEHFGSRHSCGVVAFANLGGDALMIVPEPVGALSAYSQLGAFVREAPRDQRHRLWQQVGKAMQRRLSTKPVWLNTAGAGVSWLHVRLDDRPKYYVYAPYRRTS